MTERKSDRRRIERRKPKAGVNIRHSDPKEGYIPKRVRHKEYRA